MTGAFLQPGIRVSLLLLLNMTDRNRTYRNGRLSTHSDVQLGLLIGKRPFQGESRPGKNYLLKVTLPKKFLRPTILQLNLEGLTASKMNVLHHLAMQSEALVILLQETHCTDAEKLVLPHYQLAGSSLSRKHGPCHICPRATNAYSPRWPRISKILRKRKSFHSPLYISCN